MAIFDTLRALNIDYKQKIDISDYLSKLSYDSKFVRFKVEQGDVIFNLVAEYGTTWADYLNSKYNYLDLFIRVHPNYSDRNVIAIKLSNGKDSLLDYKGTPTTELNNCYYNSSGYSIYPNNIIVDGEYLHMHE